MKTKKKKKKIRLRCGYCEDGPFRSVKEWREHIKEKGCNWDRDKWKQVTEAKEKGISAKALEKLLAKLFPKTFGARGEKRKGRRKRMSPETRARLRALRKKRVRKPKLSKGRLSKITTAQGKRRKEKRERRRRR